MIIGIALCTGWAVGAGADEPYRAFLEGLRDRGYHDTAIDYLDQMAASPLAPAELRASLLYEKAITLIAFSRQQTDTEQRAALLDRAQRLLEQFVADHGSHPRSNAARNQLGSLIFERARMKLEQAERQNESQLRKQARRLYEDAYQVFVDLHQAYSEQLEQIPKILDTRDRKQALLAERRKQLRADNLQTELLAAAVREETADTLPDGSDDQTEYLTEAADLYDGIYKNYRGRLAGFYARLYQGRCNQRMGKLRDALGYYGELLDQPNESEGMFTLKTKTLRLAMECWLAPSQGKYLESIKRGSQWLAMAPDNQDRQADWLAIRYHLARALRMQAEAAKSLQPPDVRTARQSVDAALKHARFVAAETGELQEPAKQLVESLGGINLAEQEQPPSTFAEARQAGKTALDGIEPARREVNSLRARWSAASDDGDRKASLQEQLEQKQDALESLTADAVDNLRLALELVDDQTPPSDLNLVRYLLAYLYYQQQQHYDAAVMADFVARRFPQSAAAQPCAKISLACYLNIFAANQGQDRSFEVARLLSTVNLIAEHWPGREATQSMSTLIPHLVNAGQLQSARELTERIPEEADERLQAELVTGRAYWGAAIEISQQLRQGQQELSDDDLLLSEQERRDRLKRTAMTLLEAAFERLPDEFVADTAATTAMLSLSRALVEDQQFARAATVLEHPAIGPLTLVERADPAAENPTFVEETYRIALEAYVGMLGDGDDLAMEKAQAVMAQLQQAVGKDAAGSQRMLGVYTNLALSIEAQMQAASQDAKQRMSQVFETFLEQLSSGSNDPAVLNWVAETYVAIGSGLDGGNDTGDSDAYDYYQRAVDSFRRLLDSPDLSVPLRTQIRVHLAETLTRMRDYSEAMAVFEQVLAANTNAVNVQVAAARTLQQWGSEDPQKYVQAINGMDNAGVKIWGWGKIATATQPHQRFRETFFEARYELARCQWELAETKQGAARTKVLATAERTLAQTRLLYPSLGGDLWQQRYRELLDRVLVAQGKPASEPNNLDLSAGNPS